MNISHVQDIMSDDVVTVGPEEDLATALDTMLQNRIRHLPVVDDEGNLVGILSDRDLIKEGLFAEADVPSFNVRQALGERRVSEVMSLNPETVDPLDDIADAAMTLIDSKISCVPVINGVKLVGILTETDFVKAVIEEAS